jgi:hypothetical protein
MGEELIMITTQGLNHRSGRIIAQPSIDRTTIPKPGKRH